MKNTRRHAAPELTLSASRAILAILAFAASVSAMTSGSLPPQALASALIVTLDAGGGIEAISVIRPETLPVRTSAPASRRISQHVACGPALLDARLMNLPPPTA